MEKDVRSLSVDRDVRCSSLRDRVWRRRDILVFLVFGERLVRTGLDGLRKSVTIQHIGTRYLLCLFRDSN